MYRPYVPSEREPRQDAVRKWAEMEGKSATTRDELYRSICDNGENCIETLTLIALSESVLTIVESMRCFWR